MLPKEELYTPPVNIRVRDNRQFGRKPMVGVHVLKSLEKFRCQPLAIEGEDSSVDIPSKKWRLNSFFLKHIIHFDRTS